MTNVIAIANQKGGIGLVQKGKRVLPVGSDP
jgi:hypothetical protein